MATTATKTNKTLHHLGRSQNEHNPGLTYHRIKSGAKEYLVTLFQGKARSCYQGNFHNNTSCPGYTFHGHCHHTDFAMQVERNHQTKPKHTCSVCGKEMKTGKNPVCYDCAF